MDKGITYDYINLYNASRSPSTVHVKNTRLRNYFRKYLLQKAMSNLHVHAKQRVFFDSTEKVALLTLD